MSVDISEFVDSLRREVTPICEATDVSDGELLNHLLDAFWDAKLDGFFVNYVADQNGIVSGTSTNTPPFPRELVALCVAYAGARIVRLRISNTDALFRAKAGPVEFETRQSANVLRELLVQLQWRKEQLMEALERTDTIVLDALTTRTLSSGAYGGFVNPNRGDGF